MNSRPLFVALATMALGGATALCGQGTSSPTVVTIGTTIQRTGVKRLGINLGAKNFYDSGQIMNNLISRNPGFEGEIWQSIIHCAVVSVGTCTDERSGTIWPADFLKGATAEWISGGMLGTTSTVTGNAAAVPGSNLGVQLTFGTSLIPSVGDYVVVRKSMPGNAQAGWSTQVTGTGLISTELADLPTDTTGKQALRLTAGGLSSATVTSYFDSTSGHSFVQLNGTYTLSFRAKMLAGTAPLNVEVTRLGGSTYLNAKPALNGSWQVVNYTFAASEVGVIGPVQVVFQAAGGTVLLDDVSLTKARSPNNPTVFRDEVVSTLQTLRPGEIRYMDSGTNWGSSLDNLLLPEMARQRTGYSNFKTTSDDVPIGLHDFLVLCQAVGAEPWFTVPAGINVAEVKNLLDYLGGDQSTTYGARRIGLGQTTAWTKVFSKIHLEYGNEVWNTSNPGATITDPVFYGNRAGVILAAARTSPSYVPAVIDLIVDGWESAPVWTKPMLAASSNYDTVSQAAYIFGPFTDASSNESIFGAMFSIPEQVNSTAGGLMVNRVAEASSASRPARTAIYETNIGADTGTVPQASLDTTIASLGGGIATVENLLLLMRDQGVVDMNIFALTQYGVSFWNTKTNSSETAAMYGTVVDMGGTSNLKRPSFLAQQLANNAIRPLVLATSQTGANPTWNQKATNGAVAIGAAHYIQSFAFTDGTTTSLILFNLSRTTALPVTFAGTNAPSGTVSVSALSSHNITDTNELRETVKINSSVINGFSSSAGLTLPPFSMTVLTSASPAISSLSASCAAVQLVAGTSTSCSAAMGGAGTFSNAVNWSTTLGGISASGLYTAPPVVSTTQNVLIKATSVQDPTISATQVLTVAPSTTISGLTVTCTNNTVAPQASDVCQALVLGTGSFSSAVMWSTNAGTITSAGVLAAPAASGTVVVKATSVQDPGKSATFAVTVTGAPVFSSFVVSSVTSTSVTLSWTSSLPVNAGIAYGPTYSTNVYDGSRYTTTPSFTITGLAPGTSYNVLLYGYPVTRQFGSMATTFSTSASTPLAVSVSCAASSLPVSTADACQVKITGSTTSSAVVWSTSAGTITSAGVLTAPATSGTAVVKATSVQDASKSASFAVTVTAAPVFSNFAVSSITPTSVTLSWTSNVPVNAGIAYGPTYSTNIYDGTRYTATPSFTVTGLAPGTSYKILVYGYPVTRQFGSLATTFSTSVASTVGITSVPTASGTSVASDTHLQSASMSPAAR